ncbi:unnamed protein product [Rotaria sordida]|uniref:F-box domain-containing protein n=1 Tax=Rotaria sordida TaxID=392033 RepID=A0A814DJ16_9BILA|nr:unnamed protein product [Rotaria sordida]
MNTSNNNPLNILDLPNEVLLNIISKLSFIDVFYSLVNINERFAQLSLDPLYIRHLDMTVVTMKSFFEYTFSVDDQVLSRICENILPQIHSQVNKLTIEQHSIERILLNASYPKLYSISFVNFQKDILLQYLTVRFNSNVIDGIQLHDEILIHMPRLNKFTFSINTKLLIENDIKTDITTKEDIQHSFIGKEFGLVQVGSYVYYKRLCSIIEYHIYTLPYQFENFLHLNNSFQGGMFHNVRCLTMKNDTHHFEHQLLKVISQDFPFLKELIIKNVLPQQKQHSSSLITFRHLILLNLAEAHVDYAEEFLVDKNIHLPCLLNLRIKFESLEMVTKNFTNDATRLTCAKLKKLHIDDEFVQSKNFQKYFPLL